MFASCRNSFPAKPQGSKRQDGGEGKEGEGRHLPVDGIKVPRLLDHHLPLLLEAALGSPSLVEDECVLVGAGREGRREGRIQGEGSGWD